MSTEATYGLLLAGKLGAAVWAFWQRHLQVSTDVERHGAGLPFYETKSATKIRILKLRKMTYGIMGMQPIEIASILMLL